MTCLVVGLEREVIVKDMTKRRTPTQNELESVGSLLGTMGPIAISRELNLPLIRVRKAIAKLKLFDPNFSEKMKNKIPYQNQQAIRNSDDVMAFCLEEWNSNPCVRRISRVATRYFGFKIGIETVKKHLRKHGIDTRRKARTIKDIQ
jgi:hypothetical protein